MTLEKFNIIDISDQIPEQPEAMGTKDKHWFYHHEKGLYLYKKARINTGEDWSEKIASELCYLLNLPHADYELAMFNGERGVITYSFVPDDGQLIFGNEILTQLDPDYPQDIKNPSYHTLDNIFKAINNHNPLVNLPLNWTSLHNINTPIDVFMGYLLLDAWIGNTDRHHENWGFIRVTDKIYLAPTYDHASSLGRNESDEKRKQRLETKDKGFSVQAYVEKCSSCVYAREADKKPLRTFDVFYQAAQYKPSAAHKWLENLASISVKDTLNLLQRIPDPLISPIGVEFAQKILEINQTRLLSLRDELR